MVNVCCRLALGLGALLLSGCLPAARYHASPIDALTEAPGRLAGLDADDMAAVQIRAEISAGGGELVLYRWSQPAGEMELALTWVFPVEGGGWRALATAGTPLPDERPFVAAWTAWPAAASSVPAAGPLAVAYGWSDRPEAAAVEVAWSDGASSHCAVSDRVFVAARAGEGAAALHVAEMTLLAGDGRVLAMWPEDG